MAATATFVSPSPSRMHVRTALVTSADGSFRERLGAVNQLVQVNSLEQLISINQTLTTDSTPATTSGAVRTPTVTQALPGVNEVGSVAAGVSPQSAAQQAAQGSSAPGPNFAGGNLTAPAALPAAQRVASSLTVGR